MKRKKIILIVIIVLLLVAILPSFYFYGKYKKLVENYNNSRVKVASSKNSSEAEDTKAILEKVGKLIELPNETPTVATVSNKEKLQNQPFFNNSQNGDRVLIYQAARKAIIYRESANKIIEVGSITINQPSTSPSPTKKLLTPTLFPTP